MGAEYELKFRLGSAAQEAILRDFPGGWEALQMQTTYYDTPSGSLSGKKYMLRKRLENGVSVCTLKTPGIGNARGEWEAECEDITSAISKLCKLGCPDDLLPLCREGLVPICGARFTRKARLLELPGCTAELALDQGILFGKDSELPLQETELELKSGSREALDAFASGFAAKYRLEPETQSKFARALALYKEV